ncbi:MAG: MFS transporter [Alcaligenaceae bacterium]|nr:MFS transporter [Alcaligenaceae bacterium]
MDTQQNTKWYYGWNIVAAATILTLLTVGMRMGIGPFFLPIISDLGFSRSELSAVIAIGMLFYGLGMPVAGHLVNTKGTRFVLVLGTAIVVASSVWTVMAGSLISFFLAYGICLSIGLAFTSPVALTPVISRWFIRQRGMALFFLSTGSMAGIAIMTPVFTYAIEGFGWQKTILGFAVLFAIITISAAIFIIREQAPEHADQLVPATQAKNTGQSNNQAQLKTPAAKLAHAETPLSIKQAIRTRSFWKIVIGLFACGYSMNLLGTHGVPMLMDHGFDSSSSALGIGLIGLVAIFSTLVLGRLSDILPRRYMLATIYFVRGLGFFGLVAVVIEWQLFGVATVGGVVWAGSIALSSAILADIYGVKLVGVLYGLAYLGHQVGGMISSWLGGWAYEVFQTHWISFGSAGALLLIAAVVSFTLPDKKQVPKH